MKQRRIAYTGFPPGTDAPPKYVGLADIYMTSDLRWASHVINNHPFFCAAAQPGTRRLVRQIRALRSMYPQEIRVLHALADATIARRAKRNGFL